MDPNTPASFPDWFDARFKKPDGTRYSKRQRDNIKTKYRLPTIRIGWAELIVPEAGDRRLSELARFQEEPQRPRRGRPRKTAAE